MLAPLRLLKKVQDYGDVPYREAGPGTGGWGPLTGGRGVEGMNFKNVYLMASCIGRYPDDLSEEPGS